MKRSSILIAMALGVTGCAPTATLELGGDGVAVVLMALLSRTGAVESVQVLSPTTPEVPVALRLDRRYPVVTFELKPDDFLFSSGAPVTAQDLVEAHARLGFEAGAARSDRGSCGRCLEPPAGNLQVVHSGDSCPPPAFSAKLYGLEHGSLAPVTADDLSADATNVIEAARRTIRMEWPGACRYPDPPPAPAGPLPYLAAQSTRGEAWPIAALSQADDGMVGVFTEGPQTVISVDGQRWVSAPAMLPGRPTAAVPLPKSVTGGSRFLVASDLGRSLDYDTTTFHVVGVEDGAIFVQAATVAGWSASDAFQVRVMQWWETAEGRTLAIAGGRDGKGAVAFCRSVSGALTCEVSILGGDSCADKGTLSGLTLTRRGWLAVGPGGYARAGPDGLRWWCQEPAEASVRVVNSTRGDHLAMRLSPVTVSVAGEAAIVCADVHEPYLSKVLTADLGPDRAFDETPLDWRFLSSGGTVSGRCGEFLRTPPGAAPGLEFPVWLSSGGRIYGVDVLGEIELLSVVDGEGTEVEDAVQRADGRVLLYTGRLQLTRAGYRDGVLSTLSSEGHRALGFGGPQPGTYRLVLSREPEANDFAVFPEEVSGRPLVLDGVGPTGGGPHAIVEVPRAEDGAWLEEVRGGFDDGIWDSRGTAVLSGDASLIRYDTSLAHASRTTGSALTWPCAINEVLDGKYVLVSNASRILFDDGLLGPSVIETDYDDPWTEEVEVVPTDSMTREPIPEILVVDSADGVAWAAGGAGLLFRVARERVGGRVNWVARRFSTQRVSDQGLRHPLLSETRFTHVRAFAPDHAVLVANRATLGRGRECPTPEYLPDQGEPGDIVEIRTDPAFQASSSPAEPTDERPWPQVISTWWEFPEPDGPLPRIIDRGLVGPRGGLSVVLADQRIWREDGSVTRVPFEPVGAAWSPALGWAVVGTNSRVAVGK